MYLINLVIILTTLELFIMIKTLFFCPIYIFVNILLAGITFYSCILGACYGRPEEPVFALIMLIFTKYLKKLEEKYELSADGLYFFCCPPLDQWQGLIGDGFDLIVEKGLKKFLVDFYLIFCLHLPPIAGFLCLIYYLHK